MKRTESSKTQKIQTMMPSRNRRANYYIYDAFDPGQFSDKAAYAEYAHAKYLEWQARYLD